MKDEIERKDCVNCAIHEYHSNLPEKIETKYEKEKDGILTMNCNVCRDGDHHIPLTQKLNERFLRTLEMKLKRFHCRHPDNQEKCKNVAFYHDSRCLYEIDGYCTLRSIKGSV